MLTKKSSIIKRLAYFIIFAELPAVAKLKKALEMIQAGKWPQAQEFLRQIAINIDTINTSYTKDIPGLKDLKKTFDEAVVLTKDKKPEAVEKITALSDVLSKAEAQIKQLVIRE